MYHVVNLRKSTAQQDVIITKGYVLVPTPEVDCEGTQRTIDFPRIADKLYGHPRYHWSVARHVDLAREVAKSALSEFYRLREQA